MLTLRLPGLPWSTPWSPWRCAPLGARADRGPRRPMGRLRQYGGRDGDAGGGAAVIIRGLVHGEAVSQLLTGLPVRAGRPAVSGLL